jgi:hypothetical protein
LSVVVSSILIFGLVIIISVFHEVALLFGFGG